MEVKINDKSQKREINDVYDAWHFLYKHPMFNIGSHCIMESIYFEVSRETIRIPNDTVKVWVEAGPYIKESDEFGHDMRLDSSGYSFDEAIVGLARKVLDLYGDY